MKKLLILAPLLTFAQLPAYARETATGDSAVFIIKDFKNKDCFFIRQARGSYFLL